MEGDRASSAYAAEFTSKRREKPKPITAEHVEISFTPHFYMFLNVARFHDISVLQFYGAKLSGAMFFSQKFTINQRRAEALLPQGPM